MERYPPPFDPSLVDSRVLEEALHLAADERRLYVQGQYQDPQRVESVLELLKQIDELSTFLARPATAAPSGVRFSTGDVINGRFRILRLAGTGGMGEVYQAEDPLTDEVVALKVCRGSLWSNPEAVSRFKDEIRLARRVSHPNVCRVREVHLDQTVAGAPLFYSMDWLEGQTLAALLSQQRCLEVETVVRIACEVATALDAIHSLGIIHRDLKPANIFIVPVGAESKSVITDFGLARELVRAAGAANETAAGQVLGTPDYMAPEQFLHGTASPAADRCALGLIVYEMVTGNKPFPGENLLSVALSRLTSQPRHLADCGVQAPRSWEGILRRALAQNPEDRFPTAEAFAVALKKGALPTVWGMKPDFFSRRKLLAGFGFVGSVALIGELLRYRKWGWTDQPKRLVMLTETTASENLGLLARTVDLLLRNQLDQSVKLAVLGEPQTAKAWTLINSGNTRVPVPRNFVPRMAREIALRSGSPFVAFTSLSQTGDERRLTVNLQLLGDGPDSIRTTWSHDWEVAAEYDLPGVVFKAAIWLRKTIGESDVESGVRLRGPEDLTTPHWEALKEYTQGNEAWQSGDPGRAILHLKAALVVDGHFALAAARMADILMANGQVDDAYSQWATASSLLAERNLTNRESLRIRGLFALDIGMSELAADVFSRYIEEFPQDALPKFYKATALARLDRYQEATELFSAAVAAEPDNYSFLMGRARHYLEQDILDQAERDLALARRIKKEDWTDQVDMAIAFARGDIAGVSRAISRMRQTGSAEFKSKSYALEACLASERTEWASAEEALLKGIEIDHKSGLVAPAAVKKRLLGEVYAAQKRRESALCVWRSILANSPGHQLRLHLACLLLEIGELREAEAVACRPVAASAWPAAACAPTFGRYSSRSSERPCLGLPPWPIYGHWRRRFEAERLFFAGFKVRAREALESIPLPPSRHLFPDYAVRLSTTAGDTPLREGLLRSLLTFPGRWWMEPERNAPGLFNQNLAVASKYLPEVNGQPRLNAIREHLRS